MKLAYLLFISLVVTLNANNEEYSNFIKNVSNHSLCKKEKFSLFVYNSFANFSVDENCSVEARMNTLKASSVVYANGKSVLATSKLLIDNFIQTRKTMQMWNREKKLNIKFQKIDKEGYYYCGASPLFSVLGIEVLGREPQKITKYLNQDENFDCFGNRLLQDCKATKFILMSYLGEEFDMEFKVKDEDGKCVMYYNIPLPRMQTGEILMMNTLYAGKKSQSLPHGEVLKGKLLDIGEYAKKRIPLNAFENTTIGSKLDNKGSWAYFMILSQPWAYYLMGM